MNIHIKECGAPMDAIKIFTGVTHIHNNNNLIWVEEYKGEPLYIVEHIRFVTLVNSYLTF